MQLYESRILYSAPDLNEHLVCKYLTALEVDGWRQNAVAVKKTGY
jgi:hypothetical protein